jgi:hypothetical protein
MMEALNIYILTFNCARNVIQRERFAAHLFDVLPQSSPTPEVLVLSLQEIAPIAYAFLGGSFLVPYLDAFHAAVDLAAKKRWPTDDVKYVNLVTHHCGLTGIMVFVQSDMAGKVAWVETAEVGVGVLEMGNKGAVGARIGYCVAGDETVDLTFVAAHIAPMEDGLDRRNQDWKSIVERLIFSKPGLHRPIDGEDDMSGHDEASALLQPPDGGRASSMFSSRSHLFVAGDLNYRTSDVAPTVVDRARFPQPVTDATDPTHHSHLLKHDQLTRERQARRTLHGLSEAPITFPPTYKYSEEAQQAARNGAELSTWKWSNHRWPSWCDRALYLELPSWMSGADQIETRAYKSLPLFPTSDHQAVALSVSVPRQPIPPPPTDDDSTDVRLSPPFPVDPHWESRRTVARTKEVIVGGLAYLGLTWEGNGLLVATTLSILGGYFVLRSLFVADP